MQPLITTIIHNVRRQQCHVNIYTREFTFIYILVRNANTVEINEIKLTISAEIVKLT